MKLHVSPLARKQVRQIRRYYIKQTGSSGWFEQHLQEALEHLQSWPNSGHYWHEICGERALFWLMKPYWIVYKVAADDLLVVLAVAHTSQDMLRTIGNLND